VRRAVAGNFYPRAASPAAPAIQWTDHIGDPKRTVDSYFTDSICNSSQTNTDFYELL
jgi:hypothetical protein